MAILSLEEKILKGWETGNRELEQEEIRSKTGGKKEDHKVHKREREKKEIDTRTEQKCVVFILV